MTKCVICGNEIVLDTGELRMVCIDCCRKLRDRTLEFEVVGWSCQM